MVFFFFMGKYLFFLLFIAHSFAAQLEIWVDRPGVANPIVGHTWMELVDQSGVRTTYEINSEGMHKNRAERKGHSIFHAWKVDQRSIETIAEEMEDRIANNERYHLLNNNCVHLIKVALQLSAIPHPDFFFSGEVPTPKRLYHYIDLLNKGYTPHKIAHKYEDYPDEYTPVGTKKSLKHLRGHQ